VRILIATDAWSPQTNGVVSTLRATLAQLQRLGHEVKVLTPADCETFPCPGYPEIGLSLDAGRAARMRLEAFEPEAIHVATEGPIGLAMRGHCRAEGLRFTTSYHTQFPQYLRRRLPIPLRISYAALRWFHSAGQRCMVSTRSLRQELRRKGFRNLVRWQRGVDAQLFRPRPKDFLDLPRPVAIYVGRLAVEKNVDAFLAMDWPGARVVVGDGPERSRLQQRFPHAHFTGFLHGEALARHLAAADVMVFPSLTDTFGLVNLEALACGVPVAAFPVPGPADVIVDGQTGGLDWDLAAAARRALRASPETCRRAGESADWGRCTAQFLGNLVPARG
jgi:glycosyltransferase involved in cell wall biosynthesis